MYNMYHENGVIIKPNVVTVGDKATVLYNGILKNSGADAVYLHVGFGNDWKDLKDIEMRKSNGGFETEVPINSSEQLKLAFKDCANNWDNNSGRNYSFEVQSRL